MRTQCGRKCSLAEAPYRPCSSSRPRSRRGCTVAARVGSPPWRRSPSCSPTLRGCDNPARRTASRAASGNARTSTTTLGATTSAVTNSRVRAWPPLPAPISLSSAGVGFSARLHPGCRPWAANRSRAASARARGAPRTRGGSEAAQEPGCSPGGAEGTGAAQQGPSAHVHARQLSVARPHRPSRSTSVRAAFTSVSPVSWMNRTAPCPPGQPTRDRTVGPRR